MALVWLPVDEATVDAMLVVARSSWQREDLDATWGQAGWAVPNGAPVSRRVFDQWDFVLPTGGGRLVTIGVGARLDTITSMAVSFAVFYAATDPDDADLDELMSAEGSEFGWRADADADRRRFDAEWQAAGAVVADRLGAPEVTGQHCSEEWHHAVWRVGARLLVVAQGEDFGSYSTYDDASVFVVRHEARAPIPAGDELYKLLCGQ